MVTFNESFGGSNFFSAPATGSARMLQVVEVFRKTLGYWSGKKDELAIHWIEAGGESELALPVIVAIYQSTSEEEKSLGLGYHCIIIDSEDYVAPDRVMNIRGQQYVHETAPGEVYDKKLVDVVEKKMKELHPNTPIHDGYARLLPRDYNLSDDAANFKLVSDVFMAAALARTQYQAGNYGFNLAGTDEVRRLRLIEKYRQHHETDHMGQPIRSDVRLELVVDHPNQRPLEIASACGYIDLIPTGSAKCLDYTAKGRFIARFVITKLRSTQPIPLSGQLLMLAALSSLSQDKRWHNILAQNSKDLATLDPRLEHFLAMGREEFSSILDEVFLPGLVFSLDVGNANDATWYSDVWAYAASGIEQAKEVIFHTAEMLTNDGFAHQGLARQFRDIMVYDEGNRIHMGHYIGNAGEKVDLRCVDQLTMMSVFHKQDPSMVEAWADTFTRSEIPLPIRMAHRLKMIRSYIPSATLTDVAYRVTFGAQFLSALRDCCARYIAIRIAPQESKEQPRQYGWPAVLDESPSTLFDDGSRQTGTGYHNPWRNR